MVDVGGKPISHRMAKARGVVRMSKSTYEQIQAGSIGKGDVLGVARTAGIMGTKWTPHLIPMCHPIAVDSVSIDFRWDENQDDIDLTIESTVTTTGKTGVEMEALAAVSITGLTIYDMCKSVDRAMQIHSVCLVEKKGGKSGHFVRNVATED